MLIYNSKSEKSAELARYYAEKRGVPADHLLGLPLPLTDTMDRREYAGALAPAVRRFLAEQPWGHTIKCLVTFYDVPLRVGGTIPSAIELERARELDDQYQSVCNQLEALLRDELGTAHHDWPASMPVGSDRHAPDYLGGVAKRYFEQRNLLTQKLRQPGSEDAMRLQSSLIKAIQQVEGESAVVALLQTTGGAANPEQEAKLTEMRGKLNDARQRILELLGKGRMAPEHTEALRLLRSHSGWLALAQQLGDDVRGLRAQDTSAALDSELPLVLKDAYDLYRWQPNPARRRTTTDAGGPAPLMVARLDGPSDTIVRRMIDDALAAEQRGLAGTFYIDARGMHSADTFGQYDEDLRKLAALVRNKTLDTAARHQGQADLTVVRDDEPELFRPGSCPDAALYCGWYSLAEYVDAFDFVPGAVAFHIASYEAKSLRDASRHYWCRELLRDGAAATLGPVDEPFLQTFPLPSQFFGLLLTGEYTLAECFQQTNPYLSWQMYLIGDPLYRPFAKNPKLKVEDVFAPAAATQPAAP